MGGGRRNSQLKLWGGHRAPSLTVDQQTMVIDKDTSGEGRPWEGGAVTREAGQSQAGRLEEGGANLPSTSGGSELLLTLLWFRTICCMSGSVERTVSARDRGPNAGGLRDEAGQGFRSDTLPESSNECQ